MSTSIDELRRNILGEGPSPASIYAQIEEQQIAFISLQFTDVMGILKNVTIPARRFHEVVKRGQWIDGSSITGFTHIEASDMFLVPDLATFAVIPWDRGDYATARVICWIHTADDLPFAGDSRHLLLLQLGKLA